MMREAQQLAELIEDTLASRVPGSTNQDLVTVTQALVDAVLGKEAEPETILSEFETKTLAVYPALIEQLATARPDIDLTDHSWQTVHDMLSQLDNTLRGEATVNES